MSTTTQILFNSPALHSLKREQLVKLCKIHSLKANGKNVEIIARLKQHAQNLPRDSPLSIAARSEEHNDDDSTDEEATQQGSGSNSSNMPRPSEQWEVVMESIAEVEENSSQGTLSSLRTVGNGGNGTSEFGTGGSKASTVSSSIKALASSLGLKRSNTKSTVVSSSSASSIPVRRPAGNDELTLHSTPYSALPPATSLPQTDHFTFTPTRLSTSSHAEPDIPLPGHILRPGLPAPENARLSMGLGLGAPSTPARKQPTTTIRLISNPFTAAAESSYGASECGTPQLKPFETDFDLIMGSPANQRAESFGFGFGSLSSWPPRDKGDEETKGIYPTLSTDDLPPTMTPGPVMHTQSELVAKPDADGDVPMPGSLAAASPPANALKAPAEPFIFGSPLPQHNVSNNQFRAAAASVLEEMNKRLREEGVDGVDLGLVNTLHAGAHSQADLDLALNSAKPLPQGGEIKLKFDKMHQQEFNKMEGIDEFLKRRSPGKKGDKDEEKLVVGKKRKSSVLGTGAGRDAHGRRIPGASVGRLSTTRVISNGRRGRVIPGAFGEDTDEEEEDDEREEKRVRIDKAADTSGSAQDEEAKRKKAEEEEEERMQKEREKEAIKRRLEMNKARRRSSVAAGGLQGRKSGRVSVGRGGVLVKPKPKPSRFGFLSSAKSMVQSVWNRGKTTAPAPPSNIPKPAAPLTKVAPPAVLKKPSIASAKPSTSTAAPSSSRVSSLRVGKEKDQDLGRGTVTSSRSRSPIPSFGASSTRSSGMQSAAGTRTSRNSSLASSSRSGAVTGSTSRNSSIVGTGVSRGSSAGVSSIGTRLSSSRVASSATVGSMGSKKMLGPAGRASATGSTSSTSRLSTSSRLLAPTASSLAKMQRPSVSALQAVTEQHGAHGMGPIVTKSEALEAITNSPADKSMGPFSPRSGKIFSTPLQFASGIPTPVKKRSAAPLSSADVPAEVSQNSSSTTGVVKQKTLAGRKPRISRSKVIARLASQRAAGTSSSSSGAAAVTPRASHGGRTRSSMGAKVQRASFAGGKRSSGGGDLLMSAKKRARQSEYARRRSRAGPIAAMDVDKTDE